MGWLEDGESGGRATTQVWRTATAIRVFGLALAVGLVIAGGTLGEALPLLASLALVATMCSALEWLARGEPLVWLTLGEGVLVAIVVASAPAPPGVEAYLAVPAIAAGVRHGLVMTVNTALLVTLAGTITLVATDQELVGARASALAGWAMTGLGVGVLASWQSRSLRDFAARQEPYAAAHELMSSLHSMAARGAVGLDSTMLASELERVLRAATGAAGTGVFVLRDGDPDLVYASGDAAAFREVLGMDPSRRPTTAAVIALSGGDRLLGQVVLVRAGGWTEDLLGAAQSIADDYALRLDTAALFESVRLMATSEERTRIAREMHDGVAQEIVALGYVVDEIEALSSESDVRTLAASLRNEVTRLVTELRFSIFDLRHEMMGGHVSSDLADYVQKAGQQAGLSVHLTLDESGPTLPPRHQVEVMRIVQEAFANVRKHAQAQNVWVQLYSDGNVLDVCVEDDGVGNALPRDRHWGLQSMHERATKIGAQLTISPRTPRGTIVRLESGRILTGEARHA